MFGGKYYSKRQVVNSHGLNYYLLVFQSKRKEYCKLEVFFNEVEVFPINRREGNRLGSSNSFANNSQDLFSEVFDYIEIFNSFKEIEKSKLEDVTTPRLDRLFNIMTKKVEDDVYKGLLSTTNVSVGSVKVYWQPVFTVIIRYLDGGSYSKPLVYRLGEKHEIESEDQGFILGFLNRYFDDFTNNLGRCLDA